MPLKPIVTYALAAVLILWVLLGAITLPNANRWFRGSGYSIQEDVVVFNGTISPNSSVAEEYGNRDFRSNIYPIDNTPPVPSQGIQGVLYDFGEACGIDPSVIPMPDFVKEHNFSKIALIQQSRTCFLTDKIRSAQLDGAIAVLVYHNGSSGYDSSARFYGMGVMPKSVNIPAYYIDLNTGVILLKDLDNILQIDKSNPQNNVVNRITLAPSGKPVLDHWQFALIIVAVMLLTSIVAISILQCHMWRMAQNHASNIGSNPNEVLTVAEQQQLTMDENFWRGIIGQPPRPLITQTQKKRQRLDQALVNLLPTRVFEEREKSEKSANNLSVDSFGTTCELTSCVICLENFVTEDVLRRLPCNHEYHRDCIDIWLTRKCASCPLCQQSIQIPTVPDEIHARAEEELQRYDSMPDLAEAWTGMVRDQQIAMRQSPLAALRSGSVNYPQSREDRSENHVHHYPYPSI